MAPKRARGEGDEESCPFSASASKFANADLDSSRYSSMTSLGVTSSHMGNKGYKHTNSYWDYLKVDSLLQLQGGREDKGIVHHDEMLFLIVHQNFELSFKLILFELRSVRDFLFGRPSDTKDEVDAAHLLDRSVTVLKTATYGFDVMETMRPVDFLEFRGILSPASGFQSVQMRQLEIILGLLDSDRVKLGRCSFREAFVTGLVDKTKEFDADEEAGTLKLGLYRFLAQQKIPELEAFYTDYTSKKRAELSVRLGELDEQQATLDALVKDAAPAQKGFIETMVKKELKALDTTRKDVQSQLGWMDNFFAGGKDEEDDVTNNDPKNVINVMTQEETSRARKTALFLLTHHRSTKYSRLADVVDGFIKLEQAFLLWRSRHARMVERQLGRRPGTGGSSGVGYLDATTSYRIYGDLWNIRAMVLARSSLSPLESLH